MHFCANCGSAFRGNRAGESTCSDACAAAVARKSARRLERSARPRPAKTAKDVPGYPLTCSHCGMAFLSHRRGKMYCSVACSRRAYSCARQRDGRAADYTAKRRAFERGAKVSRGRRMAVLERDEWICQLCGLPTRKDAVYPEWDFPVIDHIVPLSRHGEHSPANWQTAHAYCNTLKGDMLMGEFMTRYPDLCNLVLAKAA